jgi:hypothetical protein
MTENGIVTIDDWEAEYQSYPTVRPEDYYDLIELPDGHHVPVPIAKRLVGEKIVESIPVNRKRRNWRFFYCAQCDQSQLKVEAIINGEKWIADLGIPRIDGHSFYRCKTHKPTSKEENEAKESMLVRLILGGLYRSLRYVEAER